MKLFAKHKGWWIGLVVASLVVAFLTANGPSVFEALGAATGMILFSLLLAAIPWGVYRLIGKPMTTTQMMTTITAVWVLIALSRFVVSSA